MRQCVERDNSGREYPMVLRIGLSGGEVTREDADSFGDPVIEATRLCATSDGCHMLVAGDAAVGARQKGLPGARGLLQVVGSGGPSRPSGLLTVTGGCTWVGGVSPSGCP